MGLFPGRTRSAQVAVIGVLTVVAVLAGCGAPVPDGPGTATSGQIEHQHQEWDRWRALFPTPAASTEPTATTGRSNAAAAGRIQDPTTNEPSEDRGDTFPLAIRIPAIDVDAPLEILSVDSAGTLLPPGRWDAAGWYGHSPVPGKRGPSVIAGHSVAPDGPAVFVDLGALVPGDRVEVDLPKGGTVVFEVNRVLSAERVDAFPTGEIYGPTPDAQLRLITCDGEYDPVRGHWTHNLVVFATLVPA